jgi:hypothetical protein
MRKPSFYPALKIRKPTNQSEFIIFLNVAG